MGFADDFMRGLVVGRQLRQQREELGLQKQRLGMQDAFQQQQLERQKALDERSKALEDIKLVGMLPQPEQALPPGQAGPPMPLPKRTVNVPGFGVVTPPDLTDLTVNERAAKDAERSGALDLYREKQKIADERSRVDLSQAPELAKQFNLPAGPVDPKLLETAKAAALLREQLAGRAQQAALAREAAAEKAREREAANANKPLSGEASKVFAIAQSMPASIERIRQAVKGNLRGFVGGVQTGIDTDMARVVDDLADKVGRIRSGGAINKDEAASFKAQLVRTMDALKNDPAGILAALDRIEEEARSIQSSIRPNEVSVRGRGGATAPVKKLTYNPATGQLE